MIEAEAGVHMGNRGLLLERRRHPCLEPAAATVAELASLGILFPAAGADAGSIPPQEGQMRGGESAGSLSDGVPGFGIHLEGGGTAAASGHIPVVIAEQRNEEKVKIIIKPAQMEDGGPPTGWAYDGGGHVGEGDCFAAGSADKKHRKHPFPGNDPE